PSPRVTGPAESTRRLTFRLDSARPVADGQGMDRRALLGLLPAAAGLALGGAAVAVGSALLGVVAAACALAAAAGCLAMAFRLGDHNHTAEHLRREILKLEDALLAERDAFEPAATMV